MQENKDERAPKQVIRIIPLSLQELFAAQREEGTNLHRALGRLLSNLICDGVDLETFVERIDRGDPLIEVPAGIASTVDPDSKASLGDLLEEYAGDRYEVRRTPFGYLWMMSR